MPNIFFVHKLSNTSLTYPFPIENAESGELLLLWAKQSALLLELQVVDKALEAAEKRQDYEKQEVDYYKNMK